MSRNIPFPMFYDDVPIDLRFVYADEKPAGKHGFMKVNGDSFAFEDGSPARFWGTNFNSGGCFPSFDYSEKVAVRLAKIGVNIVRFHQLDSEWATPNIFQFTKGPRQTNSLDLDPESMKRLDYLIYCLKKEGIYCYLDMLTYRKFKSGDGVENAHLLGDSAKPYSNYSRKLIELQKKFAYELWNHLNPYTGLAYKDDPVFVLTEITNECDLFMKSRPIKEEPYRSEFVDLFQKYLARSGRTFDFSNEDLMRDDPALIDFKVELQETYYTEIMDYMRKIGVKIPITGTNWSINAANRKAQLVTDFCDGHVYWYNWQWGEKEKIFENRSTTSVPDSSFFELAFCRDLDKPFFTSEWDVPWPAEYRAESPILYAAVNSFQNWSGFAIHTYSYDTRTNVYVTGKEVSSSSIGGVPYREGIFNTWNDPAKFGLFYHSALITRRQDVAPSTQRNAVKLNQLEKASAEIPALTAAAEATRIGVYFEGHEPKNTRLYCSEDKIVDLDQKKVISDTGELMRNWDKNYGFVDSPRSQCIYGKIGAVGKIELSSMTVVSRNDFAVIALSSLSDSPVNEADNMLLTTVGRSENTDMKFNEEHTQMLDFGRAPITIEVIEAEISIRTERKDLKVWGVNAEGFYTGELPSRFKDGIMTFNVGDVYPSMYYLIRAE